MAQVPSLPSNGQPIDTQYIYDIVSSLISINGELATTGGATLTITGVDNSAVYYTVNYTTKGKTTLDINVIAIGV